MRAAIMIALATSLTACAYIADWSRPPTVDGHPDLISKRDLEIVLDIARHRMSTLLTPVAPTRVEVVSAHKVTVWYRPTQYSIRYVTVERIRGQWRATDEILSEPRIIVTG